MIDYYFKLLQIILGNTRGSFWVQEYQRPTRLYCTELVCQECTLRVQHWGLGRRAQLNESAGVQWLGVRCCDRQVRSGCFWMKQKMAKCSSAGKPEGTKGSGVSWKDGEPESRESQYLAELCDRRVRKNLKALGSKRHGHWPGPSRGGFCGEFPRWRQHRHPSWTFNSLFIWVEFCC